MPKLPFLHNEEEYSYNVYGIQYLQNKSTHKRTRLKTDIVHGTSNVQAHQNGDVKASRSVTAARKSKHSSDVYRKNDALYVSNDWTENLFDKVSLADVDWLDSSAYAYENLVLSGGGSKGYAFIGALKVRSTYSLLTCLHAVVLRA